MSYTPTTWANGDTITAEKMNNIEQGIVNASSGGSSVVNVGVTVTSGNQEVTFTLDKTWAEINEITETGGVAYLKITSETASAQMVSGTSIGTILYLCRVPSDPSPSVEFSSSAGSGLVNITFTAESENDYPTYTQSDK